MRTGGSPHWRVGNSPHCIPAVLGPALSESFTVRWESASTAKEGAERKPKGAVKDKCKQWTVLASSDLMIQPESIATAGVRSRGVPTRSAMFLEAVPLNKARMPLPVLWMV